MAPKGFKKRPACAMVQDKLSPLDCKDLKAAHIEIYQPAGAAEHDEDSGVSDTTDIEDDPEDCAHFDDIPEVPDWSQAKWEKHVQKLDLGRPLKLALPCVGIDACTEAMRFMHVDVEPQNIYDIEQSYKCALEHHYAELGLTD
eukprot:4639055-Karenia_brevis.AAC.1